MMGHLICRMMLKVVGHRAGQWMQITLASIKIIMRAGARAPMLVECKGLALKAGKHHAQVR